MNLFDDVERKVQDDQVAEVVEVLYLGNLVVIELKLDQLGVLVEAFDLFDEVFAQTESLHDKQIIG